MGIQPNHFSPRNQISAWLVNKTQAFPPSAAQVSRLTSVKGECIANRSLVRFVAIFDGFIMIILN